MVSSYASPFLQMKHTRYLSLIRMLCCPAREPFCASRGRLENEDRAGSSPHEAGTGCSESHDCRIPISGNFQEGRQRELGDARAIGSRWPSWQAISRLSACPTAGGLTAIIKPPKVLEAGDRYHFD